MTTIDIDWSDPKYMDPMEEVYAVRRAISARYGHDVHRLFEAVAEQQRAEEVRGRKYVRLPIARVAPAMA